MISTEKYKIDNLKDRQPFLVPERFFEDFTENFMCSLPQKTASESKVISFFSRIKPWLYLAAVFIGLIIFFNVYNKVYNISKDDNKGIFSSVKVDFEEMDDADFLDYIEDMYVDKFAVSFIYDYYIID